MEKAAAQPKESSPAVAATLRRSAGSLAAALALLLAACTGHVSAAEIDRLAEALELEAGMRVADVGAGDGEWSEELARRVGEAGRVYATEVEQDKVEELRQRAGEAGLGNVTSILGGERDTGLPEDCCDAILLRLVYHHFTEPAEMRASLKRALATGGVLAVVEISPQRLWAELTGVPDRGGHGIPLEDLVEEMTADGFEVVERYEEWPGDDDHYCVVFRPVRG